MSFTEEFKKIAEDFQEDLDLMLGKILLEGTKEDAINIYNMLSSFSSFMYAKCLSSCFYLFDNKKASLSQIEDMQREFCLHVIGHFREHEEILQLAKIVTTLTGQNEKNDDNSRSGS